MLLQMQHSQLYADGNQNPLNLRATWYWFELMIPMAVWGDA